MYKFRMKIFVALLGLVFIGLIAKLVQLQVIQGQDFRDQAEQAMRKIKVLPVMRGKITDRLGRILAMDEPCFDLCLDYRLLTDNERWAKREIRRIRREMGVDTEPARAEFDRRAANAWQVARQLAERGEVDLDESVRTVIRKVLAVRRIVNRNRIDEVTVAEERQCHPVVPGIDDLTAQEIRMRMDDLVGVKVEPSYRRWYPFGADACHVIGYTGNIWEEEEREFNLKPDAAPWLERMRTNYLPGDTIGKVGVEKMCEKPLRGRRGFQEVRRTGRVLREEPTVQGADIHLTLDIVLQKKIAGMLEAKGFTGAAVVLNLGSRSVPMNEVLAMVSVPTYDLNTYKKDYPKLVGSPENKIRLPLTNRAITVLYQPGSTVKPIAAVAGLAEKVISTHSTINCQGYLYNPTSFRCWIYKMHGSSHGPLNVVESIQRSCNVFYYAVGQRLGARRLCEWFRLFGMDEPPGTGLPNERGGTVPTEDWMRATTRRGYRPSDARFMAVGQGLLTVTPTHMADAVATIARDGLYMSPMIALEGGPTQVRRDLNLMPADIRAVKEGMYRVVNNRHGTAYKIFHGANVTPVEGMEICGKTGTATTAPQRVDSNNNGRIDGGDRIVRSGDTAWFVGFAPRDNPQIALAVTVEYVTVGGGGANAGPIAREIFRTCRQMGYIR